MRIRRYRPLFVAMPLSHYAIGIGEEAAVRYVVEVIRLFSSTHVSRCCFFHIILGLCWLRDFSPADITTRCATRLSLDVGADAVAGLLLSILRLRKTRGARWLLLGRKAARRFDASLPHAHTTLLMGFLDLFT